MVLRMSEESPHALSPKEEAAEQREVASILMHGRASGPKEDEGAPAAATRVLLLDDDPAISRIVQNCLNRHGYSVTLVASGVDGILQVMENNFGVILCDMMMPGMTGEMFYRAIERIQPELCSRIVFITGHRGDPMVKEFVRSVNGHMLLKPFHPTDLLDAVGFALVCNLLTDHTVPSAAALFDRPIVEPVKPGPASPRTSGRVEPRELRPPAEDWEAAVESGEARWLNPQTRALATKVLVGVAVVAALCAIPAGYYYDLKQRSSSSATQLETARQTWVELSQKRPNLTKSWADLQALQHVQGRLAEEQAAPRWMPVLRAIATATVPGLQLRSVRAQSATGAVNDLEVRISGVCSGPKPRESADRFRETIERKLGDLGAERGAAKFDRMEEELNALGQPDPQNVSFDLTIKTGAIPSTQTNPTAKP